MIMYFESKSVKSIPVHSSEPTHPHLPKLRGRKKIVYGRLPEVNKKPT